MKRRSVHNDPIGTSERDRGAVIVRMSVDLDTAVPAARPSAETTAAPKAPSQK